MIWESSEWKKDLLKTSQKFRKRIHQKRWTEKSLFLLEKETFFAFFSIRKLLEAEKLSNHVTQYQVPIQCFNSKGLPVTKFNWDKIDKLYDLENPSNNFIQIKQLCNQFIHSYIFVPSFSELGELDGILFRSDNYRQQNLFKIKITVLIEILNIVGSDYISCASYIFDQKLGDYKLKDYSI